MAMEHAPTSTERTEPEHQESEWERKQAELERQLPEDAFDLEALGPDRIAVLYQATRTLWEKFYDAGNEEAAAGADELTLILGKGLKKMVAEDPDRAMSLFLSLIDKDNPDAKQAALDYLARPLTEQYAKDWDPEARQQFFRKIAERLLDDDEFVREAAFLQSRIDRSWVDEETEDILDKHGEDWWLTDADKARLA